MSFHDDGYSALSQAIEGERLTMTDHSSRTMSSADPQGTQAFPEELMSRETWLEPFDWYHEMREENPVRYDPKRKT